MTSSRFSKIRAILRLDGRGRAKGAVRFASGRHLDQAATTRASPNPNRCQVILFWFMKLDLTKPDDVSRRTKWEGVSFTAALGWLLTLKSAHEFLRYGRREAFGVRPIYRRLPPGYEIVGATKVVVDPKR